VWTLVIGTATFAVPNSRAEFPVGAELPEFTLKTPDGSTLALQRQQGRLLVTHGKEQVEPKALVLHLLQPDCLQCQVQIKALEGVHEQFRKSGVFVAGITHRGDAEAARVLAGKSKVTFPLAIGTGSDIAMQFAAGDSFAITDSAGRVRFAQVGYGDGDEKTWKENIERLLAGKPVAQETIARKRLQTGDRLPLIELPSVASGKPIALTGDGARLTFRGENGEISHPKVAIGFFSRY
jgi:peroxiredoxin